MGADGVLLSTPLEAYEYEFHIGCPSEMVDG